MGQTLRLARYLDRIAGRAVLALWLGAVLAAGFQVLADRGVSPAALALFALAALPGLAGLQLASARALSRRASRFIMALAWVLPALAATAALGGPLTFAALVFLAGPAAMAASGRQGDAALSWTLNAIAFSGLAMLQLLGPAPDATILASGSVILALAGFLAMCGLVASARYAGRLKAARTEVSRLRPAASAFLDAPGPLLAVDRDGVMTAASRAVHRLIPGVPRDLTGLPLEGLAFDDGDRLAIRDGLQSVDANAGMQGFDFAVRGTQGRARTVHAVQARSADGLVLSLVDGEAVTGQAQAAPESHAADHAEIERIRAERDEAIAASRAKSEFLAAVSHELRTPLNAIIGFSDVMKQRLFGPLPARYAEYGDLIHESGIHLLDLIGDVLDMSKIEADRYELVTDRFDARDVVETCAKMLRLRAEDQGLTLSTDAGSDALEVDADRKAVRQILLNLISNAVKFTPEGGAVAVMARAQGDELVLAVGDSGVGMGADELRALGGQYTQTRSSLTSDERGSGLGLSLVRSLAEMHGGRMTVQSVKGEGTTVTIRLPVLVEARGDVETFEPLAVHEQIRRAQSAGDVISQAANSGAA